MIREGKTFQIPSLMQAGQAVGMQTMDMALERLVAQKRITQGGGAREGLDKESFQKTMARLAARGLATKPSSRRRRATPRR